MSLLGFLAFMFAICLGWLVTLDRQKPWNRDKRPYSVRLAEWKQSDHRRPS